MEDAIDYKFLHSDLKALEKLENYTLESKMLASQQFSSRIMNGSEVDMDLAYSVNVMPWELEIFTAYSIIFNNDEATENIDSLSFANFITYIRNYWDIVWNELEKNGTYAESFMMRAAIQQLPVQGPILQKLFRYNYFFNFKNEKIDMVKEFISKFSTDYSSFEFAGFALFLLLSNSSFGKIDTNLHQRALIKIFSDKVLMSTLCIEKEKYITEMKSIYSDDLIKLYYGLKAHYWWPFIEEKNEIYMPSPFLIINAVTESMLNRLTLGNKELRDKIGKEVIENYLFDIYGQVEAVTWISKEIEYSIGRKKYKTSDVLVAEGDYFCFYDTKEMVPSLKVRELDKQEIEKDIGIYAKAVIQIYSQIQNYKLGYFELDKEYEQSNIFGAVVMLEDISLSRKKMYEKAFALLQEKGVYLSDEEKQFIKSHIKVVSLRQIETRVLENNSFLSCLIAQENSPEHWCDLNFMTPIKGNGFIAIYDEYCRKIKKKFKQFVLEL